MGAETIGYAVLAALIYSLVFYAKHHLNEVVSEPFEPTKLGATLIIGAIIGVIFHVGNVPITAASVEIQLFAYAGFVGVVESVLKAIYRAIKEKIP